jgi:hypothetical protein
MGFPTPSKTSRMKIAVKQFFTWVPILALFQVWSAVASGEPSITTDQTVEKALELLENNGPAHSAQLAEKLRDRIAKGTLKIKYDAERFSNKEDLCGGIGFIDSEIPTMYVNLGDGDCAIPGKVASTIVHEYEHIRILEDEMFEKTLPVIKRGETLGPKDFEQKAVDYLRGAQAFTKLMNDPNYRPSVEDFAHILAFQLFVVYTESKAYLAQRRHLGITIRDAWSDEEIIHELHQRYLQGRLPPAMVAAAFAAAKAAKNYDDFLEKTKHIGDYTTPFPVPALPSGSYYSDPADPPPAIRR